MSSTHSINGEHNHFDGDARVFWGKLTDNDWRYIDGQRDRLIATLQERYGWSHDQAKREVDMHYGREVGG